MSFYQGDACNLPNGLGQFGCVLVSNLIDRLANPYLFLDRIPSLVAPGGTLVITLCYSWKETFTPKVCLVLIDFYTPVNRIPVCLCLKSKMFVWKCYKLCILFNGFCIWL